MTTEERAQLAAVEHYDRRRAELAPNGPTSGRAYNARTILARARRAELLDPEPYPYTVEPNR